MLVFGWYVVQILFDTCRCHHPSGHRINSHINQVPFSWTHRHLLFAERHQQIFHKSPVEEGSDLADRPDLHKCEFSDGCLGMDGCRNQTSFVVVIDKHLQLIPDLRLFGHITCRQQDLFARIISQIGSEIEHLDHFQCIVFSYVYHISFRRLVFRFVAKV